MGSAYYLVLDNKEPVFDTFMNGKFLACESEGLAKAAEAAGLEPLEHFISMSPDEAAAVAEELGADCDLSDLPKEQWFAPDEGLQWISAITRELGKDKTFVANNEGLVADFEELSELLRKAKAIGAKWHLAVDF